MRRISVGELQIGVPLPFDVFDSDHRLFLRRGNRISGESQLESLVQHGIFQSESGKHEAARGDADHAMPLEGLQPAGADSEVSVSPFRMLDDCARSLDGLLRTPTPGSDAGRFADRVELLAARIQRLCQSDGDAALAYVSLGQAPQYAVKQQINVAILCALMLSRLASGSVRAKTAVSAALTMNIGMMDLHDELYWVDQPLDECQRSAVRQHPIASVQVLLASGVEDRGWLEIVAQHHEALDGSGYPRGIKKEQICTEARILAVADRYNGMLANRAYRPGMTPDFALRELARRDARATDPSLVALLNKVLGAYPPGTVVALANKEVGVVTKRLLNRKPPIVHTLFLDPRRPYGKPIKRFTGKMPQFAIAKALPRDELELAIDPEQLWPRISTCGPQ